MSMFDSYETAGHVRKLLAFVGMSRKVFLSTHAQEGDRLPGGSMSIKGGLLEVLQQLANQKARIAEDRASTFADRFLLALAYDGGSYQSVAVQVGFSRETVRRWGLGVMPTPGSLARLAKVLQVPLAWLEEGHVSALPPDSCIGVRVGSESMECREALYDLTLCACESLPAGLSSVELGQFFERLVWEDVRLSALSRQAGGRWVWHKGGLVFASWVPLPHKRPTRCLWPDAVEAIIGYELQHQISVYAAHKAIKTRCEALGLPYPKQITLYKRSERVRARVARFGIDLQEIHATQ